MCFGPCSAWHTAKDPQLHLLVVLAPSTAARAGELLAPTWGNVDLKDGRILLRVTKNAEPRVMWLHGEALCAKSPETRTASAELMCDT